MIIIYIYIYTHWSVRKVRYLLGMVVKGKKKRTGMKHPGHPWVHSHLECPFWEEPPPIFRPSHFAWESPAHAPQAPPPTDSIRSPSGGLPTKRHPNCRPHVWWWMLKKKQQQREGKPAIPVVLEKQKEDKHQVFPAHQQKV